MSFANELPIFLTFENIRILYLLFSLFTKCVNILKIRTQSVKFWILFLAEHVCFSVEYLKSEKTRPGLFNQGSDQEIDFFHKYLLMRLFSFFFYYLDEIHTPTKLIVKTNKYIASSAHAIHKVIFYGKEQKNMGLLVKQDGHQKSPI